MYFRRTPARGYSLHNRGAMSHRPRHGCRLAGPSSVDGEARDPLTGRRRGRRCVRGPRYPGGPRRDHGRAPSRSSSELAFVMPGKRRRLPAVGYRSSTGFSYRRPQRPRPRTGARSRAGSWGYLDTGRARSETLPTHPGAYQRVHRGIPTRLSDGGHLRPNTSRTQLSLPKSSTPPNLSGSCGERRQALVRRGRDEGLAAPALPPLLVVRHCREPQVRWAGTQDHVCWARAG